MPRRPWLAASLTFVLVACGATHSGRALAIETDAFQLFPGNCGGVGVPPFRIERDGVSLRFVDAGTGLARRLVWPHGFSAWLENGVGILYASNGTVVGRERDVIADAGGCPRSDGSLLVDDFSASQIFSNRASLR
jgi:hypothetical protein